MADDGLVDGLKSVRDTMTMIVDSFKDSHCSEGALQGGVISCMSRCMAFEA